MAGPSESGEVLIIAVCQRFIDDVLKPKFLPTVHPTQFNYPIDSRSQNALEASLAAALTGWVLDH